MSVFRKFKLPQLLRTGSPGSEIGEDIPRFKCSELPIKQRIGQGSFGDVYTTEYKSPGDTKCHTVVVKKMLQVLDQEEKKLFYKEVRLLNDLHHPNIVCYDARIHQGPTNIRPGRPGQAKKIAGQVFHFSKKPAGH